MKTLKEARRELEVVESDIMELEGRKRKLHDEIDKLREQDFGLVPHETMVRELDYHGEENGTRSGMFIGMYNRYRESNWIKVRLVKNNGEVGLRTVIFYDWKKEAT